jgi:hypothetical protein
MTETRIPKPLAVIVGEVIGQHYYNHRALDSLFWNSGASGDPPLANCEDKVAQWLLREAQDPKSDVLSILGKILEVFMEVDSPLVEKQSPQRVGRERIRTALARYGLTYMDGGKILEAGLSVPARSLAQILRDGDLAAVKAEFDRAVNNLTTNPRDSITAACTIIEAACKTYIEDHGLSMPGKQSVKPLWAVVQKSLGLDPASLEDKDLAQILTGLVSIVDGIGSLRTHSGSAHGQGRRTYSPGVRHARLAVNAAHTLTMFLLETWHERRRVSSPVLTMN